MSEEVRVAMRLLGEYALEVGVSLSLDLHYKFILGWRDEKSGGKNKLEMVRFFFAGRM